MSPSPPGAQDPLLYFRSNLQLFTFHLSSNVWCVNVLCRDHLSLPLSFFSHQLVLVTMLGCSDEPRTNAKPHPRIGILMSMLSINSMGRSPSNPMERSDRQLYRWKLSFHRPVTSRTNVDRERQGRNLAMLPRAQPVPKMGSALVALCGRTLWYFHATKSCFTKNVNMILHR